MVSVPEADLTEPMSPAVNRRGSEVYFIASLTSQAAALLRYVTLARVLGPEQLGLAATLVVTSAFFDLISDTGSDRFIVQDAQGDSPDVQKLCHSIAVGRGVAVAVALLIFTVPIAALYKQPALVTGLPFLALSPLIVGFSHLDMRRFQRRHDFRSEALMMIVAEVVSLPITLIAAFLTRNYTAILYGLTARALVMLVISHVRAERPYALGWARAHAPRVWAFGGPLLLNGFILFIGSQSDRLVVANQLGAKILGGYSAILLLVFYPCAVLNRFLLTIYVPQVAGSRDSPREFARVRNLLGGQTMLLSIVMAAGFAIVAPTMVTLLYGGRYTQPALIVGLIGLLQTTRFLIVWPTSLALGLGDSRALLTGNLARICVFPGAFIGLKLIGGLSGVVIGFAVGELISINVALINANRIARYPMWSGFDRLGLFVLTGVAIVALDLSLKYHWLVAGIVAGAGSIVLAVIVVAREWSVIEAGLAMIQNRVRPFLSRVRT